MVENPTRTTRQQRVLIIVFAIAIPSLLLFAVYHGTPRRVSQLPNDPASRRAIEIATKHMQDRGWLYRRYEVDVRQDEDDDQWHWAVDFTHIPGLPGGHKTAFVSKDFREIEVFHGE